MDTRVRRLNGAKREEQEKSSFHNLSGAPSRGAGMWVPLSPIGTERITWTMETLFGPVAAIIGVSVSTYKGLGYGIKAEVPESTEAGIESGSIVHKT